MMMMMMGMMMMVMVMMVVMMMMKYFYYVFIVIKIFPSIALLYPHNKPVQGYQNYYPTSLMRK